MVIAISLRFVHLLTLPSGLWIDEAMWALDARSLVHGDIQCCPMYFEEPSGGHPLFAYLTAVVQVMGAAAPLSSRITAAIMGVVTVAISFWVYRTFARASVAVPQVDWVALSGTGALASLFAHVAWSRVGMEGITLSMFALVLVWTTWLALDRRSYRWAVVAGGALGLSLYTYVAAQSMIGVTCIYTGWRIIHARHERGGLVSLIRVTGVLFIVAVLVYSPLATTILREPEPFLQHLQGTSSGTLSGGLSTVVPKLFVNLSRTIAGISLQGDLSEGRNLPGRPLLDPFASFLCWLGVWTAVNSVKRSSVYQLILVWACVGLLPAVFSDEAPNFTRLLGAAPALTFLVGVGMAQLWYLAKRIGLLETRMVAGLCVFVFIFGALFSLHSTISDYFGGWGTEKVSFNMFRSSPRRTVELAQSLTEDRTVYFSPSDDPMVKPIADLFLTDTYVRQINGENCMPLAWNNSKPVVYGVVALADKTTLDNLHVLYPNGRVIAELFDLPDTWLYSQFFEVPSDSVPTLSMTTAYADFSGGLRLKGYSLSTSEITPGSILEVGLYWQAYAESIPRLISFVHIARPDTLLPVTQHDGPPCDQDTPTSRWQPDEVYFDQHLIQIPHELSPGVFQVRVGLYNWPSEARNSVDQTDLPTVMEDLLVLTDITVVGP